MTVPAFTAEGILSRPLARRPRRLAVVRLHAFGDTVAVLPLVGAIRTVFPDVHVDVVTGPSSAALFDAHLDVDTVHVLDARASRPWKVWRSLRLAVALRTAGVDAVLDLQRSRLSRMLLKLVHPPAFATFDRFAPVHGLERYLRAAERLGLGALVPRLEPRIHPRVVERASDLLERRGHDPARPLVSLNPAGGWPTKQWPLERYVDLGRRLERSAGAQIVLLGAGDPLPRVRALARALGANAVDLAGSTTPDVAMAVLARASLAVSDDSGLMHLAWVQGVPTIGIFGASRATWCRPWGPDADGFYSEDLPCGACMRPVCARGDLHCLDRVAVDAVLERALRVLRRQRSVDR